MTKFDRSRNLYQGIFIAAPTPMRADFSIDPEGFGPLVDRLEEAGLKPGDAAYTVLGAGGEHMALTIDERKRVAEAAVAGSRGRIQIFIGVTHPSTALSIELARHA